MIIAIDGPSGTGKGTVARRLAERLAWVYFDTGAMYRAFAYACLQKGIALEDEVRMREELARFDFRIEEQSRYFLGSEEVTEAIRSVEVTRLSSAVSAIPWVRERLVAVQRQFGQRENAIFEGRDIGTVVFPQAEVKIFLTARPEVRAQRRYAELVAKGVAVTFEEVLADLECRDQRDANRCHSPLRQAEGAICIDTSELSIEEVVERVMAEVPL